MPRAPRPVLQRAVVLILAAVLMTAVAGCGGTESVSGSAGASASSDNSDSVTIDITVKDKTVRPTGSTVKVKAGTPIHLRIQSDMDGELHVHSSPEQHIEFTKGLTEKTLTIDQPGVVDVEIHSLDKLVVQLEIS